MKTDEREKTPFVNDLRNMCSQSISGVRQQNTGKQKLMLPKVLDWQIDAEATYLVGQQGLAIQNSIFDYRDMRLERIE
jgi:hypothetical protein